MSRRKSEERRCQKILRSNVVSLLLLKLQVSRGPLLLQHFMKLNIKNTIQKIVEGKLKLKFYGFIMCAKIEHAQKQELESDKNGNLISG